MKNTFLKVLIYTLATLSLAACGGGGGGGGSSNPPSSSPPPSNQVPPPSNETPPGNEEPEEPEEPDVPMIPDWEDLPPEFKDPAGPYAPRTSAKAPTDAEAIEKMLGVALLINQATISLYPIHNEIGEEVESRGFLDWDDPDQWYTIPLMLGGEVRIEWWSDLGVEGFSNDDYLIFTANDAGLMGVSGPVSVTGMPGMVREYFFLHTMDQWGVFVGDTKNYRLDGSIFIEPYGADGYHMSHSVTYIDYFTELVVKETTPKGIVDYRVNFDLYTKAVDPGVIDGEIEWVRQNDGVYQYMQTFSPVRVDMVGDKLQMVSGSFYYVHNAGDDQRVFRVSVAPDPTFLLIEVDEDWDGEYDTSYTLSQSDINFLLP